MWPKLVSANVPPDNGSSMSSLEATLESIDRANAEDPNQHQGQPLALVQGRAASDWLSQLVGDASSAELSAELQLAVRAHHLRRWELVRSDYPEGRAGYLRWRRDNKAHQADSLAAIMAEHGGEPASIDRTRSLLGRTKLRTDPETQHLEDAACLVFLQTQFDAMSERTEHDHLVSIVAKTLKKMSEPASALAGSVHVSETSARVLVEAADLATSLESP